MIFSHILDHQMRKVSVDRSERTTSQKAGRRSRLFDRAVLKDFDEVEDEDDKPESSTDQIQLFMKMRSFKLERLKSMSHVAVTVMKFLIKKRLSRNQSSYFYK